VRTLLVVAAATAAVAVLMIAGTAWLERRRIDRDDRAARSTVARWLARLLDGRGGGS
jgi:hypothetical protein